MKLSNVKDVQKQIRILMIKEDLDISELALKIGITSSALSGRLKQKNMSINLLIEIVNALDYEMDISFIKKE